ncbi:alpha-tocopherol transfer protein-like [Ixodes scapularis]
MFLLACLPGEPDLRCPSDDAFLVKFLRARKYSVEEAFSTIRKYFRVRKLHRDIFEDLRPSRVMFDAVFRRNKLAVVLDERDHLGRLVAILKFGAWKPDVCDVIDLFRIGVLGADYYLLDETTQIAGIVGILDLEGLSLKHFRHYTPSAVKKLIQLAQDSYPMRIKGIYVVNNPAIYEIIYRFAKLFLKQKIINRACAWHSFKARRPTESPYPWRSGPAAGNREGVAGLCRASVVAGCSARPGSLRRGRSAVLSESRSL